MATPKNVADLPPGAVVDASFQVIEKHDAATSATLRHYAEIAAKEAEVAGFEMACEEVAEEHKGAKKAFDRAVCELRMLIRQGPERPARPNPQRQLFAANQDPQPAGDAGADPHAWQSVPVGNLDLPEKIVAMIEAAGIETVGALESQRASADGLRGIPKVGEATADKIETALVDMLTMTRDARAFK